MYELFFIYFRKGQQIGEPISCMAANTKYPVFRIVSVFDLNLN